MSFLIDTGAASTSLHAGDSVRRLGLAPTALDAASWPIAETLEGRGVGGSARYRLRPAFYGFREEDGSVWTLEGEIRIGELRPDTQAIPSLLGWDVLHFRPSADGRAQTISLERA